LLAGIIPSLIITATRLLATSFVLGS
jgi:hypothetical protein